LVFSPVIAQWELSAMASDLVELVSEPGAGPAAEAFQPIAERPGNGLRLGFPRKAGNLRSKAFRFSVSDIEGHVPTCSSQATL
jgi:hypothetical protein